MLGCCERGGGEVMMGSCAGCVWGAGGRGGFAAVGGDDGVVRGAGGGWGAGGRGEPVAAGGGGGVGEGERKNVLMSKFTFAL